jgi:nitrogen regulatory protein P-II 1
MKRIELLINHEKLHEVNKLLRDHKVGGLTSYDIKGRGRTKHEPITIGRGAMKYIPEFGSRIKVEVVVPDSIAKPIIDDVLKLISTGSASDGKIFVYGVAEAYDIGTKQTGDNAL